MILRNAIPDDAPQLINLLIQLNPKYELSTNTMLERIAAFDAKGHRIFVAENEGVLVAGL